jgi:hypothetical protein
MDPGILRTGVLPVIKELTVSDERIRCFRRVRSALRNLPVSEEPLDQKSISLINDITHILAAFVHTYKCSELSESEPEDEGDNTWHCVEALAISESAPTAPEVAPLFMVAFVHLAKTAVWAFKTFHTPSPSPEPLPIDPRTINDLAARLPTESIRV